MTSRRHFMGQVAVSATLAFANRVRAGKAAPADSNLRAWRTAGEDRYKEFDVQPWVLASSPGAEAVVIEPMRPKQIILGFGGAFTDASCYLLNRMEPAARLRLMNQFYGSTGLDFSVGRTCIGASDYSRSLYSFDDSDHPDPELKRFSIEHDRAYILPTLRNAIAVNPEIFLFSAPWSPPGWMKENHSMLGGFMQGEYLSSYAQYFVRFLRGYQEAGVHIQAVCTQNESETDQDGKMPATYWGQEYESHFIRQYLGPALQQAGLNTKIWLLDHNYDLWQRVFDQLRDPELSRYVHGIAWHGYAGTPDAMTRIHDAYPDKGAYWTEGGPTLTDKTYATEWAKWSATFTGILRNWASCIVSWNLVLDEKGMPNIGPFQCGGLVTLNSRTQEITPSGQYWAFAHYSKLVRRGARVLNTRGGAEGISHVAFANPKGDMVLVLTNEGKACQVECHSNSKSLRVELPQNSVITLNWS